MLKTLGVDHHADYAGWRNAPANTHAAPAWSPRKTAGWVLGCVVLSWTLLLTPLLLLF